MPMIVLSKQALVRRPQKICLQFPVWQQTHGLSLAFQLPIMTNCQRGEEISIILNAIIKFFRSDYSERVLSCTNSPRMHVGFIKLTFILFKYSFFHVKKSSKNIVKIKEIKKKTSIHSMQTSLCHTLTCCRLTIEMEISATDH